MNRKSESNRESIVNRLIHHSFYPKNIFTHIFISIVDKLWIDESQDPDDRVYIQVQRIGV